jgi:hypothetical protein
MADKETALLVYLTIGLKENRRYIEYLGKLSGDLKQLKV